jgi:1,4-dihydroxy-2-naphthoate octaprenyltransferase
MTQSVSLSRRELWLRLLLYPTHTLPTAAAPALVGLGLAYHDRVFSLIPALVGFLASWLLHVGGVFIDNYELLVRHPEIREHPELQEALQNGTLSLNVLRTAIGFCFIAAILTGPYLLHVAGPAVVVFGVLGIVASASYAGGGPLTYARLGLADPIFFLMFGVVAVAGTYYVQAAGFHLDAKAEYFVPQALPWTCLVLGLPVGALVTNVLLIDDIRDRGHDGAKGWHTGSVRFGVAWTRGEIVGLTIFAYAIPFWFWLGLGFGPAVLLPLLTLPRAVSVARTVCMFDAFTELFPMTPKASFLSLYYGALLAIGIAI